MVVRGFHGLRWAGWLLVVAGLGLGVLVRRGQAGWPPKVDLIEPFFKTNMLIHFETEANFWYELQYTEQINTNGLPGPYWTNLFQADNPPFVNHYAILDTGVRKQRFYRLRAYR